jgi:hypothetical protein
MSNSGGARLSSSIGANGVGSGTTPASASLLQNPANNSLMNPSRSQIKRHKMIYHCKFGEFGMFWSFLIVLCVCVY